MQVVEIKTKKIIVGNPVCCSCGIDYKTQQGHFFQSNSPIFAGNKGFFRVCKSCVEKLYIHFVSDFEGNEYKAMERICQILDIYFNSTAFEAVLKKNKDGNIVTDYIKKMQLFQYNGKTYCDTIVEAAPESINNINDVKEHDDSIELKKAVSVWGFGYSPEEYTILNDMFDDWKSRVVIDGKTRETLVRELCIIKLQMNLALKDNSVELYTKLMKTYQATMKSANLQPLQEDANDKAAEKPLGVMIQMFENERPIQKCRPEWEDVDGIVRYIQVYFIGHLSAMLKLKNKYAEMYKIEIDNIRSKNPFLKNMDDEEVFTTMFAGGGADGNI